MKEKEKLNPLKCENCLREDQSRELNRTSQVPSQQRDCLDVDLSNLETMSSEDAEILTSLLVSEKKCVDCSKRWCKFTQDMLELYVQEAVQAQSISETVKVVTNMHSSSRKH